ncbi:MAG: MMPL family transporter [Syntrophomonadaceae bacterium]
MTEEKARLPESPLEKANLPRRLSLSALVSIILWAVLLFIAFLYSPKLQSVIVRGTATVPGSQSDAVNQLKAREFPNLPTHQLALIFTSSSLPVMDAAYQGEAEQFLQKILVVPGVKRVSSPWNGGGKELIGRDGRTALVILELQASDFSVQGQVIPAVGETMQSNSGGLGVYLTGEAAVNSELMENILNDVARAERYVVPIILLLLIVIFRSVIAALLPLALGLVSVFVTMGLFYFYARGHLVHESITSLISMLGMGVGVDYALFLTTRFREELGAGHHPARASHNTVLSSGQAIVFSGTTVAVSVASLYLVNSPIIRSLALAMVLLVAVAVLAATTLLPVLLTLLGERINSLPIRLPQKRARKEPEAYWHDWALRIMNRPWVFTVLALLPLLLIAAPVAIMKTGWPSISLLPPSASARQGYHILEQQFSGGVTSPIEVLVPVKTGTVADSQNLPLIYNLVDSMKKDPAVDNVISHVSLQSQWTLADYKKIYLEEPARLSQLPQQLGKAGQALQQSSQALQTMNQSLGQMQSGLDDLAGGEQQLADQTRKISSSLARIYPALQQAARKISSGDDSFKSAVQALDSLQTELGAAEQQLAAIRAQSPDNLQLSRVHEQLIRARTVLSGQPGQPGLVDQIKSGNADSGQNSATLQKVATQLQQLDAGLQQIAAGSEKSGQGIQQISAGMNQTEQGLEQVSSGIERIGNELKAIETEGGGLDLTPLLARGDFGLRLLMSRGGQQTEQTLPTLVNLDRGATVARILVIPKEGPDSPSTTELVRRLRSQMPRQAGELEPLVGGTTAILQDMNDQLDWALPRVIVMVLLVTFLVLVILLRSLILPLTAVLMNALSAAAAYGALVLVFQKGLLADLLGFTPLGYLESPIIVMLFAILFGLSMDYEIFLLSRIKEVYDQTGDNQESIAVGLAKTAGIITGAAAIMVLIFAVFASIGVLTIKEMGLGLAVAVLLDASLIRIVLAPALMRLTGRWNWWAPRWLLRILPRFDLQH